MHIGPHKTATTYLQNNFYRHRKELRKRGWLYPDTGERVRIAHHDISDNRNAVMSEDNRFVRELRAAGAVARAEGLNLLLSSEGFRKWLPRHFRRLMQLTGQDELHLVYAVRDPCDRFYAQWAQLVKNGSEEDLPAAFARKLADPLESRQANPVRVVGPVMEKLGATATILLYDEIVARKLDIFSIFAEQVLASGDLKPVPQSRRNMRFPIELTEFIRLLNKKTRLGLKSDFISMGTAADLLLLPGEKREIIAAVSNASEARREMEVERSDLRLREIETEIVTKLSRCLYPYEPGQPIFRSGPARWVYYDSDLLRADPAVAELLKRVLRRVSPESLVMRSANGAYAALIALRRRLKEKATRQIVLD
jgi:hypothetical protein